MYYTTEEYFEKIYDLFGRQDAVDISSTKAFELWRDKARGKIAEIIGLRKMEALPRGESAPKLISSEQREGYKLESWLMETQRDIFMDFYLLIPEKPNGAAILNPHGHGPGRDANIDNKENLGVLELYKRYPAFDKEPFAVLAAKRGYVVAIPDAAGAGLRREKTQQGEDGVSLGNNSHSEINKIAMGFGMSVIGLMVYDLMRLVDFLIEKKMADRNRIMAAGMSGGGHQSLFLAALDERIALSITSGYFYGYKEALLMMPDNCACNYAPLLMETVDMGDIGAMIAPRPFMIESGRKDPFNGKSGIKNVLSQVEITKSAYRLLDVEDRLSHSIHDEGHVWMDEGKFDFIERWL